MSSAVPFAPLEYARRSFHPAGPAHVHRRFRLHSKQTCQGDSQGRRAVKGWDQDVNKRFHIEIVDFAGKASNQGISYSLRRTGLSGGVKRFSRKHSNEIACLKIHPR
jgi:hypothetical protein